MNRIDNGDPKARRPQETVKERSGGKDTAKTKVQHVAMPCPECGGLMVPQGGRGGVCLECDFSDCE